MAIKLLGATRNIAYNCNLYQCWASKTFTASVVIYTGLNSEQFVASKNCNCL